jgi:hypothetical protein
VQPRAGIDPDRGGALDRVPGLGGVVEAHSDLAQHWPVAHGETARRHGDGTE